MCFVSRAPELGNGGDEKKARERLHSHPSTDDAPPDAMSAPATENQKLVTTNFGPHPYQARGSMSVGPMGARARYRRDVEYLQFQISCRRACYKGGGKNLALVKYPRYLAFPGTTEKQKISPNPTESTETCLSGSPWFAPSKYVRSIIQNRKNPRGNMSYFERSPTQTDMAWFVAKRRSLLELWGILKHPPKPRSHASIEPVASSGSEATRAQHNCADLPSPLLSP